MLKWHIASEAGDLTSQRPSNGSRWLLIPFVAVSWLALAVLFVVAPAWLKFSGEWYTLWGHFEYDPPAITAQYLKMWKAGLLFVPAMIGLLAVIIFQMRRLGSGRHFWLIGIVAIVLPVVGIGLIVTAVHFGPRHHLAHTILGIERLPQYALFPTYLATAKDESKSFEQQSNALLTMAAMRVCEHYGISPPADRSRDSSLAVVNAYLAICNGDKSSRELRWYAAGLLNSYFIEGYFWKYPEDAAVDISDARRCVASIFVDAVRDGGPLHYELPWDLWTLRPGDWSKDSFEGLWVSRENVVQLAGLLTDTEQDVRAEAAAALGAIGSTEDDAQVLAALETIANDPSERVRELAAEAIHNISSGSASEDAGR